MRSVGSARSPARRSSASPTTTSWCLRASPASWRRRCRRPSSAPSTPPPMAISGSAPTSSTRCAWISSPGRLVPEVSAGVDGLSLDHDLVVQVRPRGPAGVTGVANHGAAHDALTVLHAELRQMAVERADILAVIEHDRRPVVLGGAGVHDGAGGRGVDRCPLAGPDVHAAMKLPALV